MMLVVGTIRLPPAKVPAARPVMRAIVEGSRAEDGCLEYSYAEDLLDPGLIHVKELWRDRACLERHFGSDHIAAWRASWAALGIGDRKLVAYEVGEPQPT